MRKYSESPSHLQRVAPDVLLAADEWETDFELYVDVLECKARVWPARWMTQRTPEAIAAERRRLLLSAPLLVKCLKAAVA